MKIINNIILSTIIAMNIILFSNVKAADDNQSIPSVVFHYSFDKNTIIENEDGTYSICDLSGNGYNAKAQKNDFTLIDNTGRGEFIIPTEAFAQTTSFTMNFWLAATPLVRPTYQIINFGNISMEPPWGSGMMRICSWYENNQEIYSPTYGDLDIIDLKSLNMYTIVKKDNTIQMYINGALVTDTIRNALSHVNFCDIAVEGTPFIMCGEKIDEVSFFNEPLKYESIAEIYENGLKVIYPTDIPTTIPTIAPTAVPTAEPTITPTTAPTATPSTTPTESPVMKYPYMINSISIVSEDGTEYDTPPADKSFIVNVDITKTSTHESKDYFIVTAYDTDGALISMNYIKANLPTDSDFSYGVNIPKTDKPIGSIKAFVWDALGGMTPLAESKVIEWYSLSKINS